MTCFIHVVDILCSFEAALYYTFCTYSAIDVYSRVSEREREEDE